MVIALYVSKILCALKSMFHVQFDSYQVKIVPYKNISRKLVIQKVNKWCKINNPY
jgi:hypothetical protein